MILRARRHVGPGAESDFFIGTKDSYISLWQSHQRRVLRGLPHGEFHLGGSRRHRHHECDAGIRDGTNQRDRCAAGARRHEGRHCQAVPDGERDAVSDRGIRWRIAQGFVIATLLRTFTAFPASVQTWVAMLGLVLSSVIGLFFGIYPAMRASNLDPVVALRAE